jgi:hypothetical protein
MFGIKVRSQRVPCLSRSRITLRWLLSAANGIVQKVHVNTCITKKIRNVAAIIFSKHYHVTKVEGF